MGVPQTSRRGEVHPLHCPDQSNGKSSRTEFSMPQSADGLRGWNFPPCHPSPAVPWRIQGSASAITDPTSAQGLITNPGSPSSPWTCRFAHLSLQTNTRIQNLAAKERAEGTQTEASLISSGQRNRAAYSPAALFSRPIFLNAKAKK